jgi:adenine-specific DNA-methyltransferase
MAAIEKGVKQAAPREKVPTVSGDVLAEQVAKLKRSFPDVVSEGKIDWNKLQATLGDAVTTAPERFSFSWAGKSEAIQLLQTPTHATLIPCPAESVDFAATGNVFIEGDNLEVLKLFFKPYFGKVKLIYIDPPYNTGQDFVYPDDYADPLNPYLKLTGQMDAAGNLLTSNPETSGRYHSSWLSMMYPRLFLARQLLREDGAIFVSIDDNEVHHLRMLMNEVFGEENFVACLVWERSKKGDPKLVSVNHEYVVIYTRDKNDVIEAGKWRRKKAGVDDVLARYEAICKDLGGDHDAISEAMKAWYSTLPPDSACRNHAHYRWSDDRGLYFADNFAGPDDGRKSRPRYDIVHPVTGKPCKKPSTGWRWDEETTKKALAENRIHFGIDETTVPCRKSYLKQIDTEPFPSVFYRDGRAATLELESLLGTDIIEFPKNSDVIRQFVELTTDDDSLVLDFFAGSCTTAQAVLELNRKDGGQRKFIMVQLPEPTGNKDYPTIAEIGKERIRRVLAKLKKEVAESLADPTAPKPDLGFKVFKLAAPHIQPWSAGDEDRDPDRYAELLALHNDPLVPGWTADNVLWEIALREGFSLNTRFDTKKLPNNNTIWLVTDPDKDPPQTLIACLDDQIGIDFSKHVELTPEQVVVVRDLALDDTAAANLALQCRLKTI